MRQDGVVQRWLAYRACCSMASTNLASLKGFLTSPLDASMIPNHVDVFRLEDFSAVIVCTERFVDACQRLGLDRL